MTSSPGTRSGYGATALFAGVVSLHALIQVFCLGAGALGLTLGRGAHVAALVVIVILSALFALRFRTPRLDDAPIPASLPTRIVRLLLTTLFCGALLWFLWIYARSWQLVNLKHPIDWDGLYYHLPAIQGWVNAGRVCWLEELPDLPFSNGYAMGNEVVTYFVYRITGSMNLVDGGNLWYWPLGFFALAEIAGRIGARGVWRWICGALLIGAPIVVSQSVTCYIDVGFACAAMAAVAAGLMVLFDEDGRRWPSLLLFGLALGLMAGTKSTGAPYAAALMAVTLVGGIVRDGLDDGGRWVRRLLAVGLVLLLVGGYWYIRNIVHTGNPVFPIQVKLGGKLLWDGYDAKMMLEPNQADWLVEYPYWLRPFVIWLQFDYPISGTGPMGGLGFIWLCGGVPAILFLLVRHLQAWRASGEARTLISPFIVLLAMVGALYLICPTKWWSRHIIWLHALGLPSLVLALRMAVRNAGRIWPVPIALLGLALTGVAGREAHLAHEAERKVGLVEGAETPAYMNAMDYRIWSLSWTEGLDRFLAAPVIARTTWGTVGTFLGGILSQPFDARTIYHVPLNPTEADLRRLEELGVEWIVWDCVNLLPPGATEHTEVPKIVRARALEELAFKVGDGADFRFIRIR